MGSVGDKTATATFWTVIEKVGNVGVLFVVSMILARLLTPHDYGVIAILLVFISIGQVFVDSGFGKALIRKLDCSNLDYSTAFFFNLSVAVLSYILLFLAAPYIACFYNLDILTSVLRVYGFALILNALTIVHIAIITQQLAFRSMAKCRILSNTISGGIAILLAYKGFGVWALVAQTLLDSFFFMLFLMVSTQWRPSFNISRVSFSYLWQFGSKMLLSGLISSVYSNLYPLIIGKIYSKDDLGYYNRGWSLSSLIPGVISSSFGKSTYPILCQYQNNHDALLALFRKYTQLISFLTFPIIVLTAVLAKPLILLVLTDKWEGAIFYIQVFSLAALTGPIGVVNLNLLMALGRSDYMLKADVIKKTVGILVIIIIVPFGIKTIAIGSAAIEIYIYVVNAYFAKKAIGVPYLIQIKDFMPYLLASLFMGGMVYMIILMIESLILQLFIGSIMGGLTYLFITKYVVRSPYNGVLLNMINERMKSIFISHE